MDPSLFLMGMVEGVCDKAPKIAAEDVAGATLVSTLPARSSETVKYLLMFTSTFERTLYRE